MATRHGRDLLKPTVHLLLSQKQAIFPVMGACSAAIDLIIQICSIACVIRRDAITLNFRRDMMIATALT
jgi:hypothetical protein